MFTNTSPARAAANMVSNHSAQFGAQMPMRSPGLRPQAIMPRATRSTSRSSSAKVNRTDWNGTTSASADPVPRDGGLEHAVDGAIEQRPIAGARHEARCGWLGRRMHGLWPIPGESLEMIVRIDPELRGSPRAIVEAEPCTSYAFVR